MSSILALIAIFLGSFGIAFSGAMMPGPLLTVTVSESARRGWVAGPLIVLGHSILELALVIALVLGLQPFLTHDTVTGTISLAGGGILIWMAVGMFRSLPSLSLSQDTQTANRGNAIIAGILMSLANPYWTIWWATVGLALLINSREAGLLGIAVFYTGHILADFVWYAAVSVTVGSGRSFMTDRLYRGTIGVCGVFLVVFACWFLYTGVNKFAT